MPQWVPTCDLCPIRELIWSLHSWALAWLTGSESDGRDMVYFYLPLRYQCVTSTCKKPFGAKEWGKKWGWKGQREGESRSESHQVTSQIRGDYAIQSDARWRLSLCREVDLPWGRRGENGIKSILEERMRKPKPFPRWGSAVRSVSALTLFSCLSL